MSTQSAFTIDDRYDREFASDGVSRYGSYLASLPGDFIDSGTGEPTRLTAEFAMAAWTIACAPIMSPGYVRWHPLVRSADRWIDDEDRRALRIELAVPAHPLTQLLKERFRDWERDWLGRGPWFEPYDNDRLVAVSLLVVRVPIPADALPSPDYDAGHLPSTSVAKQAVRTLCAVANCHLDELLAAADPTGEG